MFLVDEERCKRDGICVEACGRLIIRMKKGGFPELAPGGEDLCLKCGHCVCACPTGALSIPAMRPEECPEIARDLVLNEAQGEQFLKSRRSIRGYQDRRVEREKLTKLVELAGFAPSAHNARPVGLLVFEDPQSVRHLAGLVIEWMEGVLKESPAWAAPLGFDRIVELARKGRDPILRNAPHLFVAHADEKARLAKEDCVLALAYAELAAPSLGLGATWAGFFMVASQIYPPLKEALKLPAGHGNFGALMIGYPKVKFLRLPKRQPPRVTWR